VGCTGWLSLAQGKRNTKQWKTKARSCWIVTWKSFARLEEEKEKEAAHFAKASDGCVCAGGGAFADVSDNGYICSIEIEEQEIEI